MRHHDIDILLWLTGQDCVRVSSFGSLKHFVPANAPEGAPERCMDGCPHGESCLYNAPRFYLKTPGTWPSDVLGTDQSEEGILKALREGPYGRCVYRCDNNVVDRQTVMMEMEDGAVCTLLMTAFSEACCRQLK